jgi:hypothetical protein
MDTTTPKVVGPTDGKAGFLGSIGVRFMIGGDDSGGGFSLVEHPMGPRALAAPLHRHNRGTSTASSSRGDSAGCWAMRSYTASRVILSSNPATNGTPSGTPATNPHDCWK